jgi:DNA-binding NarL/FixJ family response regulator
MRIHQNSNDYCRKQGPSIEPISGRPTGTSWILQLGETMSLTNRIRILVLHRDPVAQAGLSVAFRAHADFQVQESHYSADRDRSSQSDRAYSADIVVTDYCQGVRLAEEMARRGNRLLGTKVVVVAGMDREWEIRSALELGVRGYLLIGCSLNELVEGVRVVHRGARHLSPQVAARLAESISLEPLTSREEEVVRLVVEGLCNKAIGRRLGIAVGTVKSHLKSAFDKLNVESRTQAMAVVERRGLLRQAPDQESEGADSQCSRSSHRPHSPSNSSRERHDQHAMSVGL